MTADAVAIALIALAYLIGSIPVGVMVGRARDVDVRQAGSGNIGATNVARTAGKGLGALVLFADALKGALPMLAALALDLGSRAGPYAITLVGTAAIAGHCYPVWLRFRGGKGVATALGVFAVADPVAIAVAVATFAAVFRATRYVSLGSMTGAAAVPVFAALLGRPPEIFALAATGAAIVIAKHRENARRLLRGEEYRL